MIYYCLNLAGDALFCSLLLLLEETRYRQMYNVPSTTSPFLPERSLLVIQHLWFNMTFRGETEGRADSEPSLLHQRLHLSLGRMPAE